MMMMFSSVIQACLGETALKVTEKLEFIEGIFFEWLLKSMWFCCYDV